jgi:hypothetical protein
MKVAMKNDVLLFINGSDLCWVANILAFVVDLNLVPFSLNQARGFTTDAIMGLKFEEKEVMVRLSIVYSRFWGEVNHDPSTYYEAKGLHKVRYYQWFFKTSHPDKPLEHQLFFAASASHRSFSAPEHHIKAWSRFRLGCSGLRVHDHTIKPRVDRICTLCNLGIEDEVHVLFKCPKYKEIRSWDAFRPIYDVVNGDIRAVMSFEPQSKIASLIFCIMRRRAEKLDLRARRLDDFSSDGED